MANWFVRGLEKARTIMLNILKDKEKEKEEVLELMTLKDYKI